MKKVINLLSGVRRMFRSKEARHALVGNPEFWEMKREFQIQFLQSRGLMPSNTLLDIGCGTLRGGIPVISYLERGRYYGIDVRDYVIKEAQVELRREGLRSKEPSLIHFEEFAALEVEQKFDYIWAFSVLFHMEDSIVGECLKFVREHLQPDGQFYCNVSLSTKQAKWDAFPFVGRPLKFYQELANACGLTVEVVGTLKELGHHTGEQLQDDQEMLKIQIA